MAQTLAEEVVTLSVIKACIEADQVYEENVREILDYYRGASFEDMKKVFAQRFDDPEALLTSLGMTNIVKQVVNLRSQVYNPAPKRMLMVGEEDSPVSGQYNSMMRSLNLTGRMRSAFRTSEAVRVCAVRFALRNAYDSKGKRILGFDVVPPHKWWAVAHPEDPTLMAGFLYEMRRNVNDPMDTSVMLMGWTPKRVFWRTYFDGVGCEERAALFDQSAPQYDEFNASYPQGQAPNTLGRIPWTLVYADVETERIKPELDDVLLQIQRNINVSLTWANLNSDKVAHPKMFLIGGKGMFEGDMLVGPHRYNKLLRDKGDPTNPEVKYVESKSYIDDHLKVASKHEENAATSNGINPETLRSASTANSGFQLIVKDRGIFRRRTEQIPIAEAVEQDQFEVLKMLSKEKDSPIEISDETTLSITFPDVQSFEDPRIKQQLIQTEVDAGVRSKSDWYIELHPNADPDEVEGKLIEIQRINGLAPGATGGGVTPTGTVTL